MEVERSAFDDNDEEDDVPPNQNDLNLMNNN